MLRSILIALFLMATPAMAWDEVPKLPDEAPWINKNETNPCTSKYAIIGQRVEIMNLIIGKWKPVAKESVEGAAYLKTTVAFLNASMIEPFKTRHYLNGSSDKFALCSSIMTVNGKPLVVTGEEGRNHIRFLYNKKEKKVNFIDYDIVMFDYREWPNPQQATSG